MLLCTKVLLGCKVTIIYMVTKKMIVWWLSLTTHRVTLELLSLCCVLQGVGLGVRLPTTALSMTVKHARQSRMRCLCFRHARFSTYVLTKLLAVWCVSAGRWAGREVAIKCIEHDSETSKAVENEVQLMISLDHANIVKAYHYITYR